MPNPDKCLCPPTPSKRFRFTEPIEEGERRNEFRDQWRTGELKRKREQKRQTKAIKALRGLIRKVKEKGLSSEYSFRTDVDELRKLLRKRRGKSKAPGQRRRTAGSRAADELLDDSTVELGKLTRREVHDEITLDPVVVLDRNAVSRHLAAASRDKGGKGTNESLATRRIPDEHVFVDRNGDEVLLGPLVIDEEA